MKPASFHIAAIWAGSGGGGVPSDGSNEKGAPFFRIKFLYLILRSFYQI